MRTLMVVDDDPMIREIAQFALETAGWSVITAGNGSEAIALAVTERPDAILMDVMMPVMDGPTACDHLAGQPETAEIPVIFFTAKVHRSDHQRWADIPIAGVIAKPFDPMRLPQEIRTMLGW